MKPWYRVITTAPPSYDDLESTRSLCDHFADETGWAGQPDKPVRLVEVLGLEARFKQLQWYKQGRFFAADWETFQSEHATYGDAYTLVDNPIWYRRHGYDFTEVLEWRADAWAYLLVRIQHVDSFDDVTLDSPHRDMRYELTVHGTEQQFVQARARVSRAFNVGKIMTEEEVDSKQAERTLAERES